MHKILKTDSAYDAIDKINANFAQVPDYDAVTLATGDIGGNGTTFAFAYVGGVRPGDLLHVDLGPNWTDVSLSPSYSKLVIGYRNADDTKHSMMMVFIGETVQSSGYDVYVSPGYAEDFKDIYIGIRALSGTLVPYTVTRITQDKMKPMFVDEMADTVAKVKDRQLNDNCLTFALCTDIHYRSNNGGNVLSPYAAIDMGTNIREFARRVRLDNVVCLGDVIDGLSTAFQSKCDAQDLMRAFGGANKPLMNVIGNHDDNRYYSSGNGDRIFTREEIVGNFIVPVDERTSIGGAMAGCNYYRDVERNKVRLVVLMGINFSGAYWYTTETKDWLSSTIASLPSGWKAVVFLHVPLLPEQTWSNTSYNGAGDIADILKNAGDKVICVFEGHTHLDNTFVNPFPAIMSSSQKCYILSDLTGAPEDSVFPTRAADDYREDLWNAVVIDQDNGIVNVIRFGAGVDRYVHTVPVEVAAGGTETLTPSVITADSWTTRASESSSISVAAGTVTVDAGATPGDRLTVRAVDSEGNQEIWAVLVS